ncbi:conserved hypothetical protein [Candidatus Terasakiella magnetica]|uniref:Transmembrane anchor protein n=1 Tax=Candidatus Terasakiella magnetica TaxID=1867952 RepID=A0A1C3RHF2_9PROT|nr:hypothetical protein [Candidatus Terasakiella magnetica]SCA56699.1 conserved hypothetical protein [Candidatus Terasakiella magnetica]
MEKVEYTGKSQHEMLHVVQSTATLVKASLAATALAAVLLVTVILPAEYDIDPTGIGANLGLTKLADEPVSPMKKANAATPESTREYQEAMVEVIVPANSGIEYKLDVKKGDAIIYEWMSNDVNLYYDFHGEPEGDTTGYFQTYTASTANTAKGTLTAPFNGTHGWYWKNETDKPVTVSLFTEGNYVLVGKK